jgi:hypothetical protein
MLYAFMKPMYTPSKVGQRVLFSLIYVTCTMSIEKMSTPEFHYNVIQGLINLSPTKRTWISICSDLFHIDNPIPNEQLINEECAVSYGKYHLENLAWTTSIVLMSWALRNFQRKTEDGHCQNTTHGHGAVEPRNCEEGRTFHRNMFNMCLQSYRDVINTFEPQPQTPSEGQNTT